MATEIRVTPGSFELQSLGETAQFSAQVLDAGGNALSGIQVEWSSTNPGVAGVSGGGMVTAVAVGATQIQATAEGLTGSATLTVTQVPAEVVKRSGDLQSQTVGQPLETDPEVEVRDGRGNPIAGAAVDFSILEGGGSVDPSIRITDAQGRASTRWTLGPTSSQAHRLQGRAGIVTTVFTAQAQPGTAASLAVASGDGQEGHPGSALSEPLTVRAQDSFGNGVPGVEVTFQTSAGAVTPTSGVSGPGGNVSTVLTLPPSVGPVLVTASAPGLGSVQFTVTARERALEVTTGEVARGRATLPYTPQPLEASGGPGGPRTWSVVAGQLPNGMQLTTGGVLEGTPTGPGTFSFRAQVRDGQGNTAQRDLSLEVCEPPLSLQRGEQWSGAPPAPGACGVFLPSGANHRYRVALVRPSESTANNDTVRARLLVTGVGGVTATPTHLPLAFGEYAQEWAAGTDPRAGVASRMDPRALAVQEATAREHLRLREVERGELQTLHARYGPALQVLPSLPGPARVTSGPALTGQAPTRRIIDVSTACASPGPQRVALLLAQNQHMAVYQDSIQRESTPADLTAVNQMLDFYEAHGKDIIDQYFGGVPDINGDGQVVVFITPDVGTNTAAFVWSGDFLTGAQCEASNEMEITFFNVNTINAISTGNFQALTTLVHEIKHVSSLYNRVRRFFNQGDGADPFHPSWIEEGTAEIAAEMASRLAWSRSGGPAPTQAVQASSFQGGFSANNYGVALRLATTVNYLSSQPNMVTNDPAGAAPTHSYYGSSWHFHRFLGDAYFNPTASPLSDASFFRVQNDSLARPGVAGMRDALLAQAGAARTFEELMVEYTTAIMLNVAGPPPPERRFRTYLFSSATEIFSNPNPPGVYPWPVTTTGQDGQGPGGQPAPSHAGFQTAEYSGFMAPTGLRIHEFLSNGSGLGMEMHAPPLPGRALRMVVVRLF